jgi:hypothetical protein
VLYIYIFYANCLQSLLLPSTMPIDFGARQSPSSFKSSSIMDDAKILALFKSNPDFLSKLLKLAMLGANDGGSSTRGKYNVFPMWNEDIPIQELLMYYS